MTSIFQHYSKADRGHSIVFFLSPAYFSLLQHLHLPCYGKIQQRSSCFIFYFLENRIYITKTCLYNFDPCIPHFYIIKLGFTGVYIIFLVSAQKYRLWVLVRTASALWVLVRTASARRFLRVPTIYVLAGGSNEYPQSMF